jgi:protein involved in polysaccharide export with SLBB domain
MRTGRSLPGAVISLIAVLLFAGVSPAQDPPPAEQFIKAGDVLQITVMNFPDFSKTVIVSHEGRIVYPVLFDQNIIGWSHSELENRLTRQLATLLRTAPYVIVDVPLTYTIRVNILGQIGRPGIIEVPNGIDLQGALWMAGGPAENADLSAVQVQRAGPAGIEVITSNVERFLYEGNLDDLVKMQEGDLIIVRGAPDAEKIKIFGEVNKSGSYVLTYGASVLDMVYAAGGPTPEGTLSDVRWIRRDGTRIVEQKLDLSALLRAGRTDEIPLVSRGDVIIVQKKIITVASFLTTTNLIFTVAALYFFIKNFRF